MTEADTARRCEELAEACEKLAGQSGGMAEQAILNAAANLYDAAAMTRANR